MPFVLALVAPTPQVLENFRLPFPTSSFTQAKHTLTEIGNTIVPPIALIIILDNPQAIGCRVAFILVVEDRQAGIAPATFQTGLHSIDRGATLI
ncbi:hypothetical protein [Chamaesiphon sp.]|uniref:hypothetical protein n=1 Tax=Chamaesiphon sp. TaxID=2814140 RepID=UPI0035939B6F